MIIPTSLMKSAATLVFKASPAIIISSAPSIAITTATTTSAAAVQSLLFWGGAAAVATDVGRFKLRLEGLHTYGVITSLLMNASLRLFSATPKRFVPGEKVNNMIKTLFSFGVAISILSGSYTTIVFSLLILYTKRALGRGYDAECVQFFQQTQPIRELAYDTFLASLFTFQIAFVLSLYLNHDKGLDWKIALFGAIAAFFCWWKWSTVMLLAEAILKLGSDM